MIITDNSEVVDTTSMEIDTFSILDSAAIYKLLYTSLYEDKEKIVVQELAANALDAHVAAGISDTPIEITLPSELMPELIVRDFGVGMSLETIKDIYPVYGASTKRTENTSIGGFGLGSKSPFALASSFIVTTTHKGVTTTVTCFLDNGKPKFSIFTSAENELAEGTEVRVPVTDVVCQRRIKESALKLFPLWNIKPRLLGDFEIPAVFNISPIIEEAVVLLPSEKMNYTERSRVFVAVGPFTYALPAGIVDRMMSENQRLWEALSDLASLRDPASGESFKAVPRFAIGDLELSPSREMIEPTKDNYTAVTAALQKLVQSPYEGAKSTFTIEWYENFLGKLMREGIFVGDKKDPVFAGVLPEKVVESYNDLLAPNPTEFTRMWALKRALKIQDLFEELEADTATAMRIHELTKRFRLVTTSHYQPSQARKLFPGTTSSRINFVSPGEVISKGTTDVADTYMECFKYSGDRQFVNWAGSRPSIGSGYRHQKNIDPRKIPVFLGDISTRNKFYLWWRGVENGFSSSLGVYTNPEDYHEQVAWLDKHDPLPEGVICEAVYTIKDVAAAWSLRPKPQKRTVPQKGVITGKKPDEDNIVIGTLKVIGQGYATLTVGRLKALLEKKVDTLYVVSKEAYGSGLNDPEDYALIDILKEFPIIEVTRKFQNRKAVKDVIRAMEDKGVKVIFKTDMRVDYLLEGVKKRSDAIKAVDTALYNLYVHRQLRVVTGTMPDGGVLEEFYLPMPDGCKIPYPTYLHSNEDPNSALVNNLPARTAAKILYASHFGASELPKEVKLSVAETRLVKATLRNNYKGDHP